MDGFVLSMSDFVGPLVPFVLVALAMPRKFFLIRSTWEVHKMHVT